MPLYLVDIPDYTDRDGNPPHHFDFLVWADLPERAFECWLCQCVTNDVDLEMLREAAADAAEVLCMELPDTTGLGPSDPAHVVSWGATERYWRPLTRTDIDVALAAKGIPPVASDAD